MRKYILKLWSLAVPLLLITTLLNANNVDMPSVVAEDDPVQFTVNGAVRDTEGEPIIGANVVIQGAKNHGTFTDLDGKFTLSDVKKNDILVISFIGFKTEEVIVRNSDFINITMKVDNTLDDVVVIGYGSQRRVDVTGSIVSVTSETLKSTVNSDVVNSLTGRTPGVRISQFSSEPGTYDTDIDIRGFGTPLFIIDGMERTKEEFSRLSNAEIESISVLKDASAAIYGVKAANGVIIVTTKMGDESKPKVSYSGKFGINRVTSFIETCNAAQYAELWNERTYNEAIRSGKILSNPDEVMASLRYSDEDIMKMKTGEIVSTDYLDLIFDPYAEQTNHSISISGGNKSVKYFISAAYFGENGLFSSNDLSSDKFNVRLNLDTKILTNLDFKIRAAYINTSKDGLYMDNNTIFKNTVYMKPIGSPYANNNPDYLAMYDNAAQNPLAMISRDKSGYNDTDEQFLQSSFELLYKTPVEGLSAKVVFGYDTIYKFNKKFRKPYTLYRYSEVDGTYSPTQFNGPNAKLEESHDRTNRYNLQASVAFDRKFNDHSVNAIAIFEQRYNDFKQTTASSEFDIPIIDELEAGSPMTNVVGSSLTQLARLSFISRLGYSYKSKYIFNGTFRADASSKFPKNSRWGFFPSASVAWRISEEPFVKDNVTFIQNIKLRASWGIMGDDASWFNQHIQGYDYPGGEYYFGETWVKGLGVRDLPNPNITWFTSETINAGIDVSLWREKLGFSLDFFQRYRKGLLTQQTLTLPSYLGVNLPQINANEDITRGYEIELFHRNRVRDFIYSISGNMSFTRVRNGHIEELPVSDSYVNWRNVKTNRYNDIVWGYVTDGIFTSYDEIRSTAIVDDNYRMITPGYPKFIDQNGDGKINDKDKRPIGVGGSKKPLINFGFNIELSYKGLDFRMLWQGGALNYIRYTDPGLKQAFANGSQHNPMVQFMDRWHCIDYTNPYDEASWVKGKYPPTGIQASYYNDSDLVFFDASYLRLKNIEIGYSLPVRWLKKILLSQARIYVNAYNLLTFQSGYDFLDPEVDAGRGYSYPVTSNINIGLDLVF